MNDLTFDPLTNAFKLVIAKLEKIELLLETTNQSQPETDELLTVQEAAKFLSLSVSTIYDLNRKRQLPSMKVGKRCYYTKLELIEYLQSGRKKTIVESAID